MYFSEFRGQKDPQNGFPPSGACKKMILNLQALWCAPNRIFGFTDGFSIKATRGRSGPFARSGGGSNPDHFPCALVPSCLFHQAHWLQLGVNPVSIFHSGGSPCQAHLNRTARLNMEGLEPADTTCSAELVTFWLPLFGPLLANISNGQASIFPGPLSNFEPLVPCKVPPEGNPKNVDRSSSCPGSRFAPKTARGRGQVERARPRAAPAAPGVDVLNELPRDLVFGALEHLSVCDLAQAGCGAQRSLAGASYFFLLVGWGALFSMDLVGFKGNLSLLDLFFHFVQGLCKWQSRPPRGRGCCCW